MGTDDRDDEYRARGQSPRRRGSYDNGASSGRSSPRGPRDDGYRSRPRGYDDDSPRSRGSSQRDYGRQDERSGGRSDRDGYERRGRPDQSYPSSRRSRDDWDGGGRGDAYARGSSAGRGPRPPMRDDRDDYRRSRGPSPADSGPRGRRPGAAVAPTRGGLWGDEPAAPAGRRRPDPRDPRALRRGLVQEEDEEETSGAAAFGKGLLTIVLALLIGLGAAYGYYVVSTPKPPAAATPDATPSASPKASPSASPKSTAPAKSALPSHAAYAAPDVATAHIAFVFTTDASAD